MEVVTLLVVAAKPLSSWTVNRPGFAGGAVTPLGHPFETRVPG